MSSEFLFILFVYFLGFITAPILMAIFPPPKSIKPPGLDKRIEKLKRRELRRKAKLEKYKAGLERKTS